MSRTLKRVPTTFDWPLDKTWSGYINPYYDLATECSNCKGGYDHAGGRSNANAALFYEQWYGEAAFDPVAYGAEPLSPFAPSIWRRASHNVGAPPEFYVQNAERIEREVIRHKSLNGFDPDNPPFISFPAFDKALAINVEARRLYKICRFKWKHHLIQADVDALVAEQRLRDFTHRPRTPEQTAQLEAQAAAGGSSCWLHEPHDYHPTAAEVNEWSLDSMCHDSINRHVCMEARCSREGVPFTCLHCNGSTTIWPTLEIKQQCEAWEETEPPLGDGYQLWQTTSEGSPISPVFESLDDLCHWAEKHATTFAKCRATAAEWKTMLESDFVHAKDEMGNVYR